jgi:beta-lactamase class D
MRNFVFLLCIATFFSSSAFAAISPDKYFPDMDGCFLLYNTKTTQFEQVINEPRCRERFVPCSTFKVPLAVMAFDAGILKTPDDILKWDGTKDTREVCNRDQTPRTWLKDSIVWVSQRITPQLGEKKFKAYLEKFRYGNTDISGGITKAWLIPPDSATPALKISAYEQVEFLKALWTGTLPVSNDAMRLTRELIYLETSPKGFRLSGKTGSNFYGTEQKMRLGWFIAHIANGDQEYIAVTNISDKAPAGPPTYSGAKAKEITKQILTDLGLW